MNKISIFIAVLSASFLISSCKKKDAEPTSCTCSNSTSASMYHFPLTIGSYWIYESDNMDSTYNVTSVAGIDSVFIANDTMISGKQYFEKKLICLSGSSFYINTLGFPSISKDSAGYMVSPSGTFIKVDDFTDILNVKVSTVPPFTVVSKMANKDSTVTVPAGTFQTINYLGKVTIMDPAYVGNRIKYNYDIMVNNIGVIYKTSGFYASPTNIGIRLLRYHIAS